MAKEEIRDEVKQEVGSYLASDEARERLGLSLPGQYEPVNGYYLPDKEKATIGFRTKDGNYSFNLGFRFQSRFTYRDNSEDHGETDKTDIDVRRARQNTTLQSFAAPARTPQKPLGKMKILTMNSSACSLPGITLWVGTILTISYRAGMKLA